MTDFTYELPEPNAFVYTLRQFLDANGRHDLSGLLIDATCEFQPSSSYSGSRWNAYGLSLQFLVPVFRAHLFKDEVLSDLVKFADLVIPSIAGYDIWGAYVSPRIEPPPSQTDGTPLNAGALVSPGLIEHDGLRFRSRTETRIYDELKKRAVLFFPNAAAILGGTDTRREPDFLICQSGKWGILEVMGEDYHPAKTAMQDHERARLFKRYGLYYIEFYPATRCYTSPAEVVDEFLRGLESFRG